MLSSVTMHWYEYTQWGIVGEKLFIGKVQCKRRWEFLVVYFWCQKSKYNHSCLPLTKMHWFGWSGYTQFMNSKSALVVRDTQILSLLIQIFWYA